MSECLIFLNELTAIRILMMGTISGDLSPEPNYYKSTQKSIVHTTSRLRYEDLLYFYYYYY